MSDNLNGHVTHTVPQPPNYPANARFLVSLQEIEPDFNGQASRSQGGHWAPPNRGVGIRGKGNPHRLRWSNGNLGVVPPAEWNNLVQNNTPYETATVFFTDSKFQAVPFNAMQHDVRDSQYDWLDIGFQYVRLTNQAQPIRILSQVDFAGAHARLAAQGTNEWIRDLFPQTYHWRASDAAFNAGNNPNFARNAGLIGRPSLLMALAAFNTREATVQQHICWCVRPRLWRHHAHPDGRDQCRGIIATVYLDPGSTFTAGHLRQLSRGHYGAFFA